MSKNTKTSNPSSASSLVSSLLKLLPTGTVFLFQFLNPVATDNGKCHHTANKILTSILISLCGILCALASFTDSFIDSQGNTRYGFVTPKGLLSFTTLCSDDDTKKTHDPKYKLCVADFVHAALAFMVFGVIVVLDPNTVGCLFPSLLSTQNTLMSVLPLAVVGFTTSVVKFFPYSRHGLGYSSATDSTTTSNSSSSTSAV